MVSTSCSEYSFFFCFTLLQKDHCSGSHNLSQKPLVASLHQLSPLKIGTELEGERRRQRETEHPEAIYAFNNYICVKGQDKNGWMVKG